MHYNDLPGYLKERSAVITAEWMNACHREQCEEQGIEYPGDIYTVDHPDTLDQIDDSYYCIKYDRYSGAIILQLSLPAMCDDGECNSHDYKE